jgi:hypothetical protein
MARQIKPMRKKRKQKPGRRKPHRWIAEVAHSCFNRFCRLLVRREKNAAAHRTMTGAKMPKA